jgi:hypothetical protein
MAADIYEALDDRFTQAGINALLQGGGFYAAEAPADTKLPYCVMTPMGEAPSARSNRTRYLDDAVQFTVVETTFRRARVLIARIEAALEDGDLAPMLIDGQAVLLAWAGNRTYQAEVGFWKAIQDFTFKLAVPRMRPAGAP